MIRTLARALIAVVPATIICAAVIPAWAQNETPSETDPSFEPPTASRAAAPTVARQPSPRLFQDWRSAFSFHPGNWTGSLGLNYMYGRQTTASEGGTSASTIDNWRESFRLANSGFYVFSPLLLTGTAEVDLDFNQDKSGGFGGSTATRGNVVGYAFSTSFLPEKPFTASAFTSRTQSDVLQPLGGRIIGTNDNLGALLHLRQDSFLTNWGYPWFEANVGLRKNHDRSTTSSFGRSQISDERSQSLELNASKGFETSDLGVNYLLNDQENLVFREGNFRSQAAALQYSRDFGPTLNRRLDATSNYQTRNGIAPSTTVSNNEHLHIDHYQNLSTDYEYGFNQQTVGGMKSTEHSGDLSVSHQLYKNLNTSAGLTGSYSTLPGGTTNMLGGQFGEGYHHGLGRRGHFSLNWSGAYQVSTNDLTDTHVSVFDESHMAPDPFRAGIGFLLNRSFAVASSVVVTDVRGGGRIPTTAGVDYEIIDQNNQIKIVPLAGSLLINPGDPLLVSYDYQTGARLKYASKAIGYGASIDYPCISFAFSDQKTTQVPLAGTMTDQFLQDTELRGLQMYLHGTVFGMAANAQLDLEDYRSTTTAYQQRRLDTTLTWQATTNMRMVFSVDSNESRYTLPDRHRSSTLSARSTLDWSTWSGWTHSASINWSKEQEAGLPTQTLLQAIGRTNITVGRLTFTANVGFGRWERGANRSTNGSFNLNLVRQLW